ncbi:MAG: hypothetical protein OEX23_07465 [Betaproteobacteria bacterium]|jgi:hypothetical protein|nr:hypothetical protein [Betaproteobacteria bacterium]
MRVRSTLFMGMLAIGCAAALPVVHAAAPIETRPVRFAKGASSATIKGSIKGDKTIDYKLGARAGQTMSVTLKASNASTYFNVLPPGSNDVAVYNSSSASNEWTGRLEADGEYKVRVYLMRSAARRNEASNYTLSVAITGDAAAKAQLGTAPASDAKVKGTPYHATGQVPCSMGSAAPGSAQCDFGVIRGKPGNAEVHVTLPGGSKRVLTFLGDKVSADGGAAAKAVKSGDGMWSVDVGGKEQYRIPDAVISGG